MEARIEFEYMEAPELKRVMILEPEEWLTLEKFEEIIKKVAEEQESFGWKLKAYEIIWEVE